MNEENPTEETNPIETDGQAESDVTTSEGGVEGVFSTKIDFPTEIPPMPSVQPPKGNRYTPRGRAE
jgi:hypothetical protein